MSSLPFCWTMALRPEPFFCPMNMQPFLRAQKGHRDITCPVAEGLWTDGFYLPSGNQLDRSTIARVCEAIAAAKTLNSMHVAAVVAGFDPQSGGGHTFERENSRSLHQAAGLSAHRFTVLCPESSAAALADMLSGSALRVVAVPRRTGRLAAAWPSVKLKACGRIGAAGDIDRVAVAHGIEFVWFLSAQPERTDLPYMTVVWDLQHRATPWFPEMSADGLWDRRDSVHRWFLQRATKDYHRYAGWVATSWHNSIKFHKKIFSRFRIQRRPMYSGRPKQNQRKRLTEFGLT